MPTCNYCYGICATQSSLTIHLGYCQIFKFQKEQFYKMQEIEKIRELNKSKENVVIINNNYINCENTIIIINIQMNMLKEEINKEFLDFEQEVMKILNEPVNKQFLIKASTEEIKNNMSNLLTYLKKY